MSSERELLKKMAYFLDVPWKIVAQNEFNIKKIRFEEKPLITATISKSGIVTAIRFQRIKHIVIPSIIKKLKGLIHLECVICDLNTLPMEITDLTELQSLSLWGNHLTALPSEIINLTGLQFLRLGQNLITTLIPEIGHFRELQSLHLGENQLTTLPPEIGHLTKLQSLDLGGNQLTSLPTGLGYLTKLQFLNLSGNQLASLLPEIGHLTELQSLNLWGNQLTILPREFINLTNLQSLDLGKNQLTVFPLEIIQLTGLKSLNFWRNKLQTFPPEISHLKFLHTLNLGGNQLTVIQRSLFDLNLQLTEFLGTKGLFLDENPITSPPPEILRQGREAVLEWFKKTETGPTRLLSEVRVLFLGDGSVGKTSLSKRIRGLGFNPEESQTHRINRDPWEFQWGDRAISARLWDFGGQAIMHSTHEFFLSERCVYVIVLDARLDRNDRAEYWLKFAETYGKGSPAIVVINKIDENPNYDVNRKFLREKYPFIRAFVPLSCKTRENLDEFERRLRETIQNLALLQSVWPERWFEVKTDLEGMDVPHIPYEKFLECCKDRGITEEASVGVLIRYFHDLGIALHFADKGLLERQVLKPEWVTDGVYRIINSKPGEHAGVLDLQEVFDLLHEVPGTPPRHYSSIEAKYIVDVMRQFELCHEKGPKAWLFPDLLPVEEPAFTIPDERLHFRFQYIEMLPRSVLGRLIVQLFPRIKGDLVWRTGVVFKSENHEAECVVRADYLERRLDLYLWGPQRRDLLAIVWERIDGLNRGFPGLNVKEQIILGNAQISYRHLLQLEQKGISEYPVEGLDESINIPEVLGLVRTPLEARVEEILQQFENRQDASLQEALEKLAQIKKEEEIFGNVGDDLLKVLKLSPNAFGVGVDLKELIVALWRRAKKKGRLEEG